MWRRTSSPDRAEAEIHLRVVDSVAAVRQRLEALLSRSRLPVAWEVETANEPQQLLVPPGAAETVVAFNTDVAHLQRFGRKLLCGPGSILVAHGPEERMAKAELRAAVQLYRRAVLQLRAAP